ncbi:MAG TPA: DUF3857 domain-containing protein, partial [Polyangiaceae bacterium]|nr:DUF3857 domain-containing protein [Polyangiaceae bacterium]
MLGRALDQHARLQDQPTRPERCIAPGCCHQLQRCPGLIDHAGHGPDAKEDPQADAVVALERDDIALQGDGSVVRHHKSIVKLLDAQRGKDKFADVHVPFDRRRQTLQIRVARTVNADGVAHPVSSEELSDIVPERLAEAAIYSDVRERVVSFPAVDVGSVIELEYTLTTAPTADAPRGGEELLATWDPVLERSVTISTPPGVTPELEVVGEELSPVVTESPQGRVWTYTVRSLPDRQPEPDAPPDAAVLPRLVYAFQKSWAEVAERVATPFARVVLPAQPAPAIRVQADQLAQGAAGAAQTAARLFAFVAHDVRSVDLQLGEAGYEPHAAEVVLANRYGDSRDKACLLLALAAVRDIRGWPVLVRTGGVPVLDGVPTLAQFDHLLVVLEVDGHEVWLDPSDENGQYGLAFAGQDNLVLPLALTGASRDARGLVHRAAQNPHQSVANVKEEFTLAPSGDLDATYEYTLSGYYA